MSTGAKAKGVDRARLARRLLELGDLLDWVLATDDEHHVFDAVAPGGGMAEGETIAGQTAPAREDYEYAAGLVRRLASRIDVMRPLDLEQLDLNADLPQLQFHLEEELRALAGREVDPVALGRSLTFLKRHIVRLHAEYEDRALLGLDPLERSLLLALARDTRRQYDDDLASRYTGVNRRRPFVDKFHRDYSLTGIPDGLLLVLDDLAHGDRYDRFVCVLKGGLAYTTMLEVFGVPPDRIGRLIAGRASGSHFEETYRFEPLDFELDDLRGQRVLIVENNLATGATLTHLAASLAAAEPARLGIFMDYVLTDLAGIDATNLSERVGVAFDEVLIGPWPARAPSSQGRDRAARLRMTLAAGLAQRAVG